VDFGRISSLFFLLTFAFSLQAAFFSSLLAVRAHIRHVHTRYDRLLAHGVPRLEARALVADAVAEQLNRWRRA